MNDYDLEIMDENIKDSIVKDSLNRNSKLNKFIELLNGINKNKIISIDGKWGCGKTVFLKQLEYINKNHLNINIAINEENLKKFRYIYNVYYYNAWENDFHESPLLSLIYNLINDFYDEQDKTASGEIELPFDIAELLKTITYNFVNLKKVTSYKDLTAEVHTANEKRDALNRLIDNILPDDRRLIFIVDELDRCRPDYAINMLEVIKHFYTNNRIIFVLGTNNQQLSYTISNYYGNNFDGYGYLNKIYNLIIELDNISSEKYLDTILNKSKSGLWSSAALYSVCNHFNFSMREINRVVNDFDFLNEYFLTSYGNFNEDSIVKYLFLPYCLGLKLANREALSVFLNGGGFSAVKDYVFAHEKLISILKTSYDAQKNNRTKLSEVEELKEMVAFLEKKYNMYFVNKSSEWSVLQVRDHFFDVFSLLSNYSKVSVEEKS